MKITLILFIILLICIVSFFIYKNNITKNNIYSIIDKDSSIENKELILKVAKLKNLAEEDTSLISLIYNDNKIALIKYSNQKGMYTLELFDVKNDKFIRPLSKPQLKVM